MPIPKCKQRSHLGISYGAIVCPMVYRGAIPEILGGLIWSSDAFALLDIPTLPDTLASVTILPVPPMGPVGTNITPDN